MLYLDQFELPNGHSISVAGEMKGWLSSDHGWKFQVQLQRQFLWEPANGSSGLAFDYFQVADMVALINSNPRNEGLSFIGETPWAHICNMLHITYGPEFFRMLILKLAANSEWENHPALLKQLGRLHGLQGPPPKFSLSGSMWSDGKTKVAENFRFSRGE